MCRADIAPAARPLLAQILADMAQELADQSGVPADQVRIGPVDFGDHDTDLPGGKCTNCDDTGHVCENHSTLPWGPLVGNIPGTPACFCGGAGMPCPTCCDPIPQDGTVPIVAAFMPRHLPPQS